MPLSDEALSCIERHGALGAYRILTSKRNARGLMTFEDLSTGASGNEPLEKAILKVFGEAFALFCDRQRKYGCGNIAKFGLEGVVIRASDKIERLANATIRHQGEDAVDESIRDTLLDLTNYGAIGMLCHKDEWPR
jgi:hypothetical protein